jgi:hypothetical protein
VSGDKGQGAKPYVELAEHLGHAKVVAPTHIPWWRRPLLGLAYARLKEYDQARNLPTSRSWPEPGQRASSTLRVEKHEAVDGPLK